MKIRDLVALIITLNHIGLVFNQNETTSQNEIDEYIFIEVFETTDSETTSSMNTTLNNSNMTAPGENPFLFIGDDQPRQDLGINLGPIDYTMAQWVFTNKFKHGNKFSDNLIFVYFS